MNAPLTCREVADRLRLHRTPRGWRGDCPACGYAGSFALSEGRAGKPLLYCASCQDGAALMNAIGGRPIPPDATAHADREAARTRKREAALRLWLGCEPAADSIVAIYLASRGIRHLTACADLRFRGDCTHPEGGRLPAMVALVRDPAGEPLAIHRTYLRRDGSGKAEVEPAKASLGPVWGGAVRLAAATTEVVVGEGIETAASAGLLTGLPAWAAISAGNLGTGLGLPLTIRTVVIAVDRDKAGEDAAWAAASRWQGEGRHVRWLLPDLPGTDAADALKASGVAHHA